MANAEQTVRTTLADVVSDKMDKTLVVRIERMVRHKLYKKYIKRFTKMYVHDEENLAKVGDRVVITPCRPISKQKCWKLIEVVEQAK